MGVKAMPKSIFCMATKENLEIFDLHCIDMPNVIVEL